MILYHFTAIELLGPILRDGLSRGDVPLSPTAGQQAVWFTTDADGGGHGLSAARPLSEDERTALKTTFGGPAPGDRPLRYIDKRRVRIRVVISSRDRKLVEWLPFARKHLEPGWMDALHRVAGGTAKAKSWWIYRGIVPPSAFSEVLVRREDGAYSALTDEDREEVAAKAASS